MEPEQILTQFMRQHYSDERLAWLLAHAESGNLDYLSCCCFIGVSTADHALRGRCEKLDFGEHLYKARRLPGAFHAENAYLWLADRESDRRKALIPLIKAEISRRESSRSQREVSEMVVV